MPKSLTFIFIVFMMVFVIIQKILLWKTPYDATNKIVINVDIGMLLTWNFQKTFKTKFSSLNIFQY